MHTSPLHSTPELRAEFERHLDQPYRMYVEGHPDVGKGTMFMGSGWTRKLGGKEAIRSRIANADDVRAICRELHIDYPIVNTLIRLNGVPETRKAEAMMRAYNDMLLDVFLDEGDDIYGLASVAPQSPEAAAEELDRIGDEDGIVGVMLTSFGLEKPLGDPRYDVLYRAAEDNDLAIVYHGGAAVEFSREAPVLTWGIETFLAKHALSHPWQQMLTLTSLIAQGTPVKFPDLDFVFQEAGIGWIPYMMGRLNREYGQRRVDAPLLEKSPEEYIREFHFGTQPIEEPNQPRPYLEYMVDLIGADSLVFATDQPHQDWDNPEMVNNFLGFMSPEEKEQVLYRNAAEIFGIPV